MQTLWNAVSECLWGLDRISYISHCVTQEVPFSGGWDPKPPMHCNGGQWTDWFRKYSGSLQPLISRETRVLDRGSCGGRKLSEKVTLIDSIVLLSYVARTQCFRKSLTRHATRHVVDPFEVQRTATTTTTSSLVVECHSTQCVVGNPTADVRHNSTSMTPTLWATAPAQ